MNTGTNPLSAGRTLWQDFLAGDRDAFARLFHLYSDAMYAYGKKITADKELVKDTIQDVFVKLHQNRANLSDTDYVKGYLFMAMKRALINKLQTRMLLSLDNKEEDVHFEIELLAQPLSDDEDDSDYSDEQRQQLALALKELTPRQREAVYLYYIQEVPLSELPALLGMNYQSTRNLLHRALLKLRQSVTSSELGISLVLLQYLSK